MAKITITIEDLPNGSVKVEATPNFETMMKLDISGNSLTSAHGYALFVLNQVRKKSKEFNPNNLIQIPRIRRAH